MPHAARKRAVIYCRVSTADQSCERQERELIEYAERANYDVVGVFKEIASGAKNDRKERAKVINLAKRREIDVVLVSETTRWGRSTQDLLSTSEELHSRGVSLISLTGISFDFSTAQGKLMATLVSALAEFERDLIVERIRSGVKNAQAKGVHCGRPQGTNKYSKYEKEILSLRADGISIREVGRRLNLSPRTVQKVCNLNKSLAATR